jgi:2'-5' RNA ligase
MATLWLSPTGGSAAAFRSRIEQYARELDLPSFAPHVTLLSGWPDESSDESMSMFLSGLTSVELPVRGVTTSTDYFRCVVIELEATAALLAMRRHAQFLAGRAGDGEYRPHLSLVYGDVSAARRERVRREVEVGLPASIRLGRLDVVRTTGPVEGWRVLVSHSLPPDER